MDTKEYLIKRAEFILSTVKQFPVCYNESMIAGWARYTQRGLSKMVIADKKLSEDAYLFFSHMETYLKAYLECTDDFHKADLDAVEQHANKIEGHMVRLGLLPRLDELTLDDCKGEAVNCGHLETRSTWHAPTEVYGTVCMKCFAIVHLCNGTFPEDSAKYNIPPHGDATMYVGALQELSSIVNELNKSGRLLPPVLVTQLERVDLAREAMENSNLSHPKADKSKG